MHFYISRSREFKIASAVLKNKMCDICFELFTFGRSTRVGALAPGFQLLNPVEPTSAPASPLAGLGRRDLRCCPAKDDHLATCKLRRDARVLNLSLSGRMLALTLVKLAALLPMTFSGRDLESLATREWIFPRRATLPSHNLTRGSWVGWVRARSQWAEATKVFSDDGALRRPGQHPGSGQRRGAVLGVQLSGHTINSAGTAIAITRGTAAVRAADSRRTDSRRGP